MTSRELSNLFHTPNFSLIDRSALSYLDLSSSLPRLYLPADFCAIQLNLTGIESCLGVRGVMAALPSSIKYTLESNPSPLSASVTEHLRNDKAPRATHIDHKLMDGRKCPFKFNCRVAVSLGCKDGSLKDYLSLVDHLIDRKLRFLCGRRKGSLTLLGKARLRLNN